MKIINDKIIFQDFCILFNSKLCVLDFYCKYNQLGYKSYESEKNDPLVLVVKDKDIFKVLNDINYGEFIIEIIKNIDIQDSCVDIFESVLGENILLTLREGINKYKELVTIEIDYEKMWYYINVAGFLSDIILPLLSQLHLEILQYCNEFDGFLKAVNGETKRLFLNAHAPTAYSQYLQMLIADCMNIPLKYGEEENLIICI